MVKKKSTPWGGFLNTMGHQPIVIGPRDLVFTPDLFWVNLAGDRQSPAPASTLRFNVILDGCQDRDSAPQNPVIFPQTNAGTLGSGVNRL